MLGNFLACLFPARMGSIIRIRPLYWDPVQPSKVPTSTWSSFHWSNWMHLTLLMWAPNIRWIDAQFTHRNRPKLYDAQSVFPEKEKEIYSVLIFGNMCIWSRFLSWYPKKGGFVIFWVYVWQIWMIAVPWSFIIMKNIWSHFENN